MKKLKKSLVKNNLKTIKRTKRRFISILIMAFLGVGFYAGLVASSPDMLDSLDRYADTSNLYDINIISTLGLTDDDINEIKKIDGIESVYGIQTKDSLTKVEDKESICKVIEYNENINTPELIEGNVPQNSDECIIDRNIQKSQNIKIGDYIDIKEDLDELCDEIYLFDGGLVTRE